MTVAPNLDEAIRLPTGGWRPAIYIEDSPALEAHVEAFRCLLQMTLESSPQIAELPALALRR